MYRNTNSVSSDYHSEMNKDIFKEWFMNMLKLLDKPSHCNGQCILQFNGTEHHQQTQKKKIIIIQNWLTEKNISFSPMEIKIKLL